MGWVYTPGWDKATLVRDRIKRQENDGGIWETLASAVKGNNLWKVTEYTDKATGEKTRWIALDLLQGGRDHGWGYKDLCEESGPYEVNCPLRYLEMVPEPDSESAREWRQRVRSYYQQKKQRNQYIAALQPGDRIKLSGSTLDAVTFSHRKGVKLYAHSDNGDLYRIPPRMVDASGF